MGAGREAEAARAESRGGSRTPATSPSHFREQAAHHHDTDAGALRSGGAAFQEGGPALRRDAGSAGETSSGDGHTQARRGHRARSATRAGAPTEQLREVGNRRSQ